MALTEGICELQCELGRGRDYSAYHRNGVGGEQTEGNEVGLFDLIKRRELTKKGLSSGNKRRMQGQSAGGSSLDRSVFCRIFLYVIFTVVTSILVYYTGVAQPRYIAPAQAVFVSILTVVGLLTLFDMQHLHKVRNARVTLVLGATLLHLSMIYFITLLALRLDEQMAYALILLPYAFAPFVNSVLLGRMSGMFTTYMVSILGLLLVPTNVSLQYMVLSLITGTAVVLLTKRVRRRGSLLRAGFYAGIVVLVLAVVFDFIQIPNDAMMLQEMAVKMLVAVAVSLLISMVVSGVLPVLESLFGVTTDISWLEMSDLNHRLLKRMQLEAPGTFHHSLIVASLAEAAAEVVGANATMCRVCAYFHDIGKMAKPTYFIENQGDKNPHDALTPSMSALIIIAHVKDGVDLAIKHKLNPVIVDVIREHHGDSLVYYFYHKAREARREAESKAGKGLENVEDLPDVNEENFRYPGPRPQSAESGIISLADCVESASRTLNKPTPAKIGALVDDIVNKRIADGMMDDCGLTLNDLRKVRESFAKTLRSMLHSRVDYPKEEDRRSDAEKRQAGRPSQLQRNVELPAEAQKATRKKTEQQGVKVEAEMSRRNAKAS